MGPPGITTNQSQSQSSPTGKNRLTIRNEHA